MPILKDLNQPQQEAVMTTEGPVLILAGAGSGKTRALTHRIAYLIKEKKVSPFNILAITFTNKAASEMISRITKLISQQRGNILPWMGTFHSVCVKILRRELDNSELPYSSNFTIYDTGDQKQLIKKNTRQLGLDVKKFNPGLVSSLISSAKSELVNEKEYRQLAQNYFQEKIADIYTLYQKELVNANVVDFDDLLNNVIRLFEKHKAIRQKYQKLFHYILIDEYQDTNQAQYILVKLLVNEKENICVVGDDFQSIYAFRGANFRNILNFEHDFPKAKIIKLEQNYRSTEAILNTAQELIKNNKARSEKSLWTDKKSSVPTTVLEIANENEEIDFIISEIKALKLPYNQVGILYRTNAQSRSLEEGLLKAGIPYRIFGGIRFYERKEIKDIIAYLRVITNVNDAISLERIINIPPRGIGEATKSKLKVESGKLKVETENLKLEKFIALYEDLQNQPGKKNTIEMIDYILRRTGYKDWILDGTIEGEARWENLQELKTVANEYPNINDFLERVALVQDTDNYNENEQAVSLMTLHSAKGLEFPVVFITGLEEGLLPHSRSLFEEGELEEERRLCYVGMTRAKERLYMIYANSRNIYGGDRAQIRSRFIDEISHLADDFVEFI